MSAAGYRFSDFLKGGVPLLFEKQRNNVRMVIEPIADYVDPPRVYPLIGPAQLHHAHYKCTVYFSEITRVGWPVPYTQNDEDAREVIYIDHNHLHMVGFHLVLEVRRHRHRPGKMDAGAVGRAERKHATGRAGQAEGSQAQREQGRKFLHRPGFLIDERKSSAAMHGRVRAVSAMPEPLGYSP